MPQERGHELIEHTADVGLRVWAPGLGELFAEAAIALVGIMGSAPGAPTRTERVRIEAPDVGGLLVDWLSEVLFLFEARRFAAARASVGVDEHLWRLHAELEGHEEASFVQHGPAVKAVTYHGLDIARTDAGYEARVYLDV